MGSMGAYIRSYDVAVFQREKLSGTHILLDVLIVGRHTLAIDSALDAGQCVVVNKVPSIMSTSGEHLAAASANFSIGLVLPGIVMGGQGGGICGRGGELLDTRVNMKVVKNMECSAVIRLDQAQTSRRPTTTTTKRVTSLLSRRKNPFPDSHTRALLLTNSFYPHIS